MKQPISDSEFTEEGLTRLRKRYTPRGSGPLLLMAIIVQLLDYIAEIKGWDIK